MTGPDDVHGALGSIRLFVDQMPGLPAVLLDRHLDVLAASALARAIEPGLTTGANIVRIGVVANDRGAGSIGSHVDLAGLMREGLARFQVDERYVALIGELVATSSGFARAWDGDQRPRRVGVLALQHEVAGVLRLEYVRLRVEGTVGATLVLARPSDEETADRLRLLDGTR